MKNHITPHFPKIAFLSLLFSLFLTSPCYAWSGYDYENKSEIDIGPGNLVREGLTIQFYDVRADDYHTAKIDLMENVAGGTRITLQDLDAKKERIFIMQE